MTKSKHATVISRQEFFETSAPELLAAAMGRRVGLWSNPPRKLSGQFKFFADRGVLAVVSWPGANQESADEALAWGLAYSADRDLVLLLPEAFVASTLKRLPWVTVKVRVFAFSGNGLVVAERVIPSKAEVLAEIVEWGRLGKGTREKQIGANRLDTASRCLD